MNIEEAKQIMENVPRGQRGALDVAMERYKRFSGIYTMDDLAAELAAASSVTSLIFLLLRRSLVRQTIISRSCRTSVRKLLDYRVVGH